MFILILLIVFLVCLLFYFGNTYPFKVTKERVKTYDGELEVSLFRNKKIENKGSIFFVHGDGPQNATQGGSFLPVIERFTRQGYTVVSWSKLGIDSSKGNWLKQNMDERSREVIEIINWFKKNYLNETSIKALFGVSQAGWVIPKVMNQELMDFCISVVPAINWKKQDEYASVKDLKKQKKTKTEIKIFLNSIRKDHQLMEKYDNYDDYRQKGGKEEVSTDRYYFLRKNLNQDVKHDLEKITAKLYVILAEEDQQVDTFESKKVYQDIVPSDYLVIKTIPRVKHQMNRPIVGYSLKLKNIVKKLIPRFFWIDKGYLDYCEEIVIQEKNKRERYK